MHIINNNIKHLYKDLLTAGPFFMKTVAIYAQAKKGRKNNSYSFLPGTCLQNFPYLSVIIMFHRFTK